MKKIIRAIGWYICWPIAMFTLVVLFFLTPPNAITAILAIAGVAGILVWLAFLYVPY